MFSGSSWLFSKLNCIVMSRTPASREQQDGENEEYEFSRGTTRIEHLADNLVRTPRVSLLQLICILISRRDASSVSQMVCDKHLNVRGEYLSISLLICGK